MFDKLMPAAKLFKALLFALCFSPLLNSDLLFLIILGVLHLKFEGYYKLKGTYKRSLGVLEA